MDLYLFQFCQVFQAFDRLVQRNEKVMSALKGCPGPDDDDEEVNSDDESNSIKSPNDSITSSHKKHRSKGKNRTFNGSTNLDETVRALNAELTKENKNLHCMVTSLQEKHHVMSLKFAEVKDKMEAKDLTVDELKNRIDELEFELNKSRTREQRLEDHFYEAREKLRDLHNNGVIR